MNPLLASAHRDVLTAAIPESEGSRQGLLDELQSRGRAAVGAKSWMDAKLLYEKAIQVAETDKLAMFAGNLSLVLRNMGEFEDARKAAEQSTQADAGYVKGWWRLGQALSGLKRYEDALASMQQAQALDPNNKALAKECGKLQKQVEEEKKLMADAAAAAAAVAKADADAMDVEVEVDADVESKTPKATTTTKTSAAATTKSAKPSTTTTSAATSTNSKPNANDKDGDKDGKDIFTKSDAVRGYKIVNGKKTSYFHNELSEEAKNLIGDIAPKKLDNAASAQIKTAEGTSAWNQAGTWEEKNVTAWATESLQQQIQSTTFALPESSPAPGAVVRICKIDKLDGHASVAQVRGKKRYIYEYAANLQWTLQHGDLKCAGKVKIHDIDGTVELGEGYEQDGFTIDETTDNNIRPLVDRFVRRGGMKDALNENIDAWVRLFKETH